MTNNRRMASVILRGKGTGMEAVPIGKGMMRAKVRNKRTRAKLARIHEIIVENDRVIFPASLLGAIMSAIGQAKKRKGTRTAIQLSIGIEDENENKHT